MAKAAKKAEADVDEQSEDEGAVKTKKKLPLKMIIMAAAGLAVLGGGGTGAYFFFGAKKVEKPKEVVVKPATFVDLPDVLVNLAGTGNGADRTQYLKVKVVIEVADAELVPKIQPLMPRVMDAFQTYLRELRPTDLEGSAGLYRLKEELTRRVNASIAPNRINAVLFKEVVVQ
jgi:flagellar FliL protein